MRTSESGAGPSAASGGGAVSAKTPYVVADSSLRGDRRLADPSPTSAAPPADDIDDLLYGAGDCPATVGCCLDAGKLEQRNHDSFYTIVGATPNQDWPAQACSAKGWVPGASLNLTVLASRARLASAATQLTLNRHSSTIAYEGGDAQSIIITKSSPDSSAMWGGTFEQPSGSCNPAMCCCPSQLQLSSRFVNGTLMGFDVVAQLESTAPSRCRSQYTAWGTMSGANFHGIGNAKQFVISQDGNKATFSGSDNRCTFGMV